MATLIINNALAFLAGVGLTLITVAFIILDWWPKIKGAWRRLIKRRVRRWELELLKTTTDKAIIALEEYTDKSLNSLLANLSAPSKETKKTLEELGVQITDEQGNLKGAGEILKEIADKTSRRRP